VGGGGVNFLRFPAHFGVKYCALDRHVILLFFFFGGGGVGGKGNFEKKAGG